MLEAKTQLSKRVEAAPRGEEVVIANRGKPVVKLVKAEALAARQWGAWEGLMTEEQIEHAFSPEVEAEMAREWIASLERPLEAGLKAVGAGHYASPFHGAVPKIQILAVEELLAGPARRRRCPICRAAAGPSRRRARKRRPARRIGCSD